MYTHPLDDQYLEDGIPGYFEGIEEEMLRRGRLVSENQARVVEGLIYREKNGYVAHKRGLPGHEIETLLELFLLGLNGVGLLIGIITITMGRMLIILKRRT